MLILFLLILSKFVFSFNERDFHGFDDLILKPINWDKNSFVITYKRDNFVIEYEKIGLKDVSQLFNSRIVPFNTSERLISLSYNNLLTLYSLDESKLIAPKIFPENDKSYTFLPDYFGNDLIRFQNIFRGSTSHYEEILSLTDRFGKSKENTELSALFAANISWNFMGVFRWKNDIYYVFKGNTYLTILRQEQSINDTNFAQSLSAIRFTLPAIGYSFMPTDKNESYLIYFNDTSFHVNDFPKLIEKLKTQKNLCSNGQTYQSFDLISAISQNEMRPCSSKSIILIEQSFDYTRSHFTVIKNIFSYRLLVPKNLKQIVPITSSNELLCFNEKLIRISQDHCILAQSMKTSSNLNTNYLTFDTKTCHLVVPSESGLLIVPKRLPLIKCDQFTCFACLTIGQDFACDFNHFCSNKQTLQFKSSHNSTANSVFHPCFAEPEYQLLEEENAIKFRIESTPGNNFNRSRLGINLQFEIDNQTTEFMFDEETQTVTIYNVKSTTQMILFKFGYSCGKQASIELDIAFITHKLSGKSIIVYIVVLIVISTFFGVVGWTLYQQRLNSTEVQRIDFEEY